MDRRRIPGIWGRHPKSDAAPVVTAKREIKMPSRMSPAQLKGLILDLPGSFELVDIRPSMMYKDFHLPQSVNVDIFDLLNNPAYLVGTGPLVIVDRDGTLAFMAAGMLYQKTKREIKALTGGLEAYWKESGFQQMAPASSGEQMKTGPPASSQEDPVTVPSPAPVSPVPENRKRKVRGADDETSIKALYESLYCRGLSGSCPYGIVSDSGCGLRRLFGYCQNRCSRYVLAFARAYGKFSLFRYVG